MRRKQLYLGTFHNKREAAEAYDVIAIKCRGKDAKTNFDRAHYADQLQYIQTTSLEELMKALRRRSHGFARGREKFRGVRRQPNGRWRAQIGVPGTSHIHLGLYNEEAEAAKAYDRALVKLRGDAAVTNLPISNYNAELEHYHTNQRHAAHEKAAESAKAAAAAAPTEASSAGMPSAEALKASA